MEKLTFAAEQVTGETGILADTVELDVTEYTAPGAIESFDASDVTLGGPGLHPESGLNSKLS